jgi:hypothetical protein
MLEWIGHEFARSTRRENEGFIECWCDGFADGGQKSSFSLLERGGGCTHNVAMLDLAFQAAAQAFTQIPSTSLAKWGLWNLVELNFKALKRAEFEAQVL